MTERSSEHQIANLRERLARLESTDVYHRLCLEQLERELTTFAEIVSSLRQETVGVVLSTRSDLMLLREELRNNQKVAGLTESTIKIVLAVALPLIVLLLTRDPQQAAGIARSLLSPGTGGGH